MKYFSQKDQFFLTAENFLFYKEKIWFTELHCNELYCYDLCNQKSRMVFKFNDEIEYQSRLFGELVPLGQKIYIVPCAAEKMYEVNITTGAVKDIIIKETLNSRYFKNSIKYKFFSGHAYKESIYLIAAFYPAIVEYNTVSGKMNYYDEWVEQIPEEKRNVFFRNCIMIENKIYAPCVSENFILEFDAETKKHIFHEVGSERCSYSSICKRGEWFWLSPRAEGPIVKWNPEKNQWIEYWDFADAYKDCKYSYADIVCFEKDIYCLPLEAETVIKITEQGDLIEGSFPEGMELKNLKACIVGHEIYLFMQSSGQFLIIDSQGNYKLMELLMPEKQKKYHIWHRSETYRILMNNDSKIEDVILHEKSGEALEMYLQYLLKREVSENYKKLDGKIGNEIYKQAMRFDGSL